MNYHKIGKFAILKFAFSCHQYPYLDYSLFSFVSNNFVFKDFLAPPFPHPVAAGENSMNFSQIADFEVFKKPNWIHERFGKHLIYIRQEISRCLVHKQPKLAVWDDNIFSKFKDTKLHISGTA